MRTVALFLLTACLAAGQGPDVAISGPFRPSASDYLTNPRVQADLGLDDAAKARLAVVLAEYEKGWKAVRDLPYEKRNDRPALLAKLDREFDGRLREHLTPAQVERLEDILTQRSATYNGVLATLRDEERVRRWKVSPEQLARWDALAKELAEPLGKALTSADPAVKFAAIRKDFEAKLLAVLTREQRDRWDAAFRRPFDFAQKESDFGRIAFEYCDLDDEAIQKALKLTPKQIDEVPARRFYREEDVAFLSPEQRRRLRELNFQVLRRFNGPGTVFLYKEVVDAVRPTAEQRPLVEAVLDRGMKHLRADTAPTAEQLRADEAALARVLTAEQRAAFESLFGSAVTLPNPREEEKRRIRDRDLDRRPVMELLATTKLRQTLGLTPDQIDAMDRMTGPIRAEMNKLGRPLPGGGTLLDERESRKREQMQRALDLPLIVLLTAEQRDRFEQIQLRRDLYATHPYRLEALRELAAADKLALTPAEFAAVEKAEEETRAVERLLSQEVPRLLGRDQVWWSDLWSQTSRAALREAVDRHDRALPAATRKRLDELLGKPVELGGRPVRVFGGYAFTTAEP